MRALREDSAGLADLGRFSHLMEETEHLCSRGQQKVAKIVHCGLHRYALHPREHVPNARDSEGLADLGRFSQLLQEIERSCSCGQEEVAKIVQCGEEVLAEKHRTSLVSTEY
jgi:hypothetical protein